MTAPAKSLPQGAGRISVPRPGWRRACWEIDVMTYSHAIGATRYRFDSLRELMARATPARSGDYLAGVAAATAEERMAAKMALADLPLARFLEELLVPYETDEVTRLIVDTH